MASSSEEDEYNDQTLSISAEDSGDGESSASSSGEEPQPKKIKTEWVNNYSGNAMRMMQKMGFQGDKGLGKLGQGRLEPVETSKQEGRRGLGLKLEDLDNAAVKWDPTMEEIEIPEKIDWLKNNCNDLEQILMDDLVDWIKIGKRKITIDDETQFCDAEILENVLSSKNVFDNLEPNDMRRARTRSNPFETIKGAIFLNRAAVKMANIDSLCDFMFTNPVDENGVSLVRQNDLLYFADICAGPGGFSEYVLFRKNWTAKGFGFTLKGENDFKLDDFCAGPPETFDAYYGEKDDGNIFDPANMKSFADYVMRQTETGVHFVMADGGFSVKGKENIQEILSKQLYLCQCVVALSILRIKGHFVCKLFDLFTPFSAGLLYLMYKCFEEICICKPNTSRPANSERYLICKWKKPNTDHIERHLFQINVEMWENQERNIDTNQLVPYEVMYQDTEFFEYLINSNNRLGKKQIVGLIKIAAFCKDVNLKEPKQAEVRKQCLQMWNIPDKMRQTPEKMSEEALLTELLTPEWSDKSFLSGTGIELNSLEDLENNFKSIYDKYFVAFGRCETEKNKPTFFLCKGRSNVQCFSSGKWQMVDCNLEIPAKTLIYGEIVTEYIGEGRSQNKVPALHIIDGIVLGGEDIRRRPLRERLKICDKFARALNKPYKIIDICDGMKQLAAQIRCKKLFPLSDFAKFFDQMKPYKLKEGPPRLGYRVRSDEGKERFFVPGGLLFFTETCSTFLYSRSKSSGKFYYFNTKTRESFYLQDALHRADVYASFRNSFVYRLLWKWKEVLQVQENLSEEDKKDFYLYRVDFNNFIENAYRS